MGDLRALIDEPSGHAAHHDAHVRTVLSRALGATATTTTIVEDCPPECRRRILGSASSRMEREESSPTAGVANGLPEARRWPSFGMTPGRVPQGSDSQCNPRWGLRALWTRSAQASTPCHEARRYEHQQRGDSSGRHEARRHEHQQRGDPSGDWRPSRHSKAIDKATGPTEAPC